MTPAGTFDKNHAALKEYQEAPWGKLAYNIRAANLKRHIRGEALTILDAGGGNGLEAVAFAKQGHTVALVDYSAEMLAEARQNVESNLVGERVEIYQGEIGSIPQLFPPARFDVALCHNVLQYVNDLDKALQAISYAVKPNGLLSIICINRYSEPYRLALQEVNLQAAYSGLDAKMIHSKVFEAPMTAYSAEDLRAPLQKAGCSAAGQYGIRCVNDYIPNNEIKSDPNFMAAMEKLELALSDKFPYYLIARFFHIVAQKNGL
jgi:S-adenosylmethionine-dependent methyltransferase